MKDKLSRREVLRLAALAGGAALLASCTPKTAATQPAAVQASETPAQGAANATPTPTFVMMDPNAASGQVKIEWWNQFNTPTCQVYFPRIIANFEKENPNIVVKYEISGGPPGGGDYTQILLARIAAGNPPDSITLWSPPSQFGARGSLLAIDDMMSIAKYGKPDQFYEGVLKSCQWNGKTYGLPASAGAGCIFTNNKILQDKGVSIKREDFPKTWDDLKALSAKFVTMKDGLVEQAGFIPWTQSWLKPVWSALNGGLLFDANNKKYTIDTQPNIDLWAYWVKWLDEQYGGDIEKVNQSGTWGDVYPNTAFAMGKSAIEMSGSWACTDAAIPFDWEVMKFPVGPSGTKSVTGYWPNWWALPKGTPHPKEAFLFSEYFCTVGWVLWYVEATMDTPAWKGAPIDSVNKKLIEMVGQQKALDVNKFFAEYLNDVADMWNSPIEDFASDTLNSSLDEVLHKKKTPDQALKEAQDLCQAKLEETLKSVSS